MLKAEKQTAPEITFPVPVELEAPRSAEDLEKEYNSDKDGGEHPHYTRDAWRHMVANDCITLGYWQWLADTLESEEAGDEPQAARALAVTVLRAAVRAKLAYWEKMRRLEAVFGYALGDIPDDVNNQFVGVVDHLAAATDARENADWVGYAHLDDLMTASGARL